MIDYVNQYPPILTMLLVFSPYWGVASILAVLFLCSFYKKYLIYRKDVQEKSIKNATGLILSIAIAISSCILSITTILLLLKIDVSTLLILDIIIFSPLFLLWFLHNIVFTRKLYPILISLIILLWSVFVSWSLMISIPSLPVFGR